MSAQKGDPRKEDRDTDPVDEFDVEINGRVNRSVSGLLRRAMSSAGGESGRLAIDDMLEGVEDDLEVLWNAMRAADNDGQFCLYITRVKSRVEVIREIYRRERARAV